jgi:diadenylate cyclase
VGLRSRIFANFWPKLAILVLVIVSWLLITFRQGEILTVTAPIKFHNLPETLTLTRSYPEEVDLQLKAFSNLIASPKQLDVMVDIDLSRVKEGGNSIQIRKEDIKLPSGVVVASMERSTIRVTTERKTRKDGLRGR